MTLADVETSSNKISNMLSIILHLNCLIRIVLSELKKSHNSITIIVEIAWRLKPGKVYDFVQI